MLHASTKNVTSRLKTMTKLFELFKKCVSKLVSSVKMCNIVCR